MPEDVAALAAARLVELERLRRMGMDQARRLTTVVEALPPELEFKRMVGLNGTVLGFERAARAVRQIIVLEFELRGLFKAPDRSGAIKPRLLKPGHVGSRPDDVDDLRGDLADRDDSRDGFDPRTRPDYRTGPLEEVVAGIRKTLGAAPPENDPFAPTLSRAYSSRQPSNPSPPDRGSTRAASVPPTDTKPAPAKPQGGKAALRQQRSALKAAMLAITAMRGKGFRTPPAKPGKPGKASAARPPRRNRGPPG